MLTCIEQNQGHARGEKADLEEAVGAASLIDLCDDAMLVRRGEVDEGDVVVSHHISELRPVVLGPRVTLREAIAVRDGGQKLVRHSEPSRGSVTQSRAAVEEGGGARGIAIYRVPEDLVRPARARVYALTPAVDRDDNPPPSATLISSLAHWPMYIQIGPSNQPGYLPRDFICHAMYMSCGICRIYNEGGPATMGHDTHSR